MWALWWARSRIGVCRRRWICHVWAMWLAGWPQACRDRALWSKSMWSFEFPTISPCPSHQRLHKSVCLKKIFKIPPVSHDLPIYQWNTSPRGISQGSKRWYASHSPRLEGFLRGRRSSPGIERLCYDAHRAFCCARTDLSPIWICCRQVQLLLCIAGIVSQLRPLLFLCVQRRTSLPQLLT